MFLAMLERRRNHPDEKIRENISLFLPMSKSIYFESLHSVCVTAENEEPWTHYVRTYCYIWFCLKGFSNISFFFFFDSGARKGGVLRTLPRHPPILICAVILLGLDKTLSLSVFTFLEGGRVEFQIKEVH